MPRLRSHAVNARHFAFCDGNCALILPKALPDADSALGSVFKVARERSEPRVGWGPLDLLQWAGAAKAGVPPRLP